MRARCNQEEISAMRDLGADYRPAALGVAFEFGRDIVAAAVERIATHIEQPSDEGRIRSELGLSDEIVKVCLEMLRVSERARLVDGWQWVATPQKGGGRRLTGRSAPAQAL